MSRTINMAITNLTGMTLNFGNAKSSEGPVAKSSSPTVNAGQTITVTAHNSAAINGGNKGTFELSNANVTFVVFYTHPETTGSTYIQLQTAQNSTSGPYCSPGVVGYPAELTYTGDPVNAAMNIYIGAPVAGTDGYAVPLQHDPYAVPNNCVDFANSMFGTGMRDSSLIAKMFDQNITPFAPANFAGSVGQQNQFEHLVDVLANAWNADRGPDAPILQFLQGYIAPAPSLNEPILQLWVPTIVYQNPNTNPPPPSVYQLTGYKSFQLASYSGSKVQWDADGTDAFLTLLAGGAHIVAISANQDFTNQNIPNTGRDLYEKFVTSSLPQRSDLTNSHYRSWYTGNVSGEYYLNNVTQNWAPQGCGLILSLLFGRTVNSAGGYTAGTYNTFMQLEGWPNLPGDNARHGADYDAYKESLWNVSTYGACPYSERRATTVFLAPPTWKPTIYQTTRMMPYVGAYATGTYPNGKPQPWLETGLVTLPTDPAPPALPSIYYA